jgi:hypothetical protein
LTYFHQICDTHENTGNSTARFPKIDDVTKSGQENLGCIIVEGVINRIPRTVRGFGFGFR